MYFRLWSHVKALVYAQPIAHNDLNDLKLKIRGAFDQLRSNFRILNNVMDGFETRLLQCELLEGGKVEVCRRKLCTCQR